MSDKDTDQIARMIADQMMQQNVEVAGETGTDVTPVEIPENIDYDNIPPELLGEDIHQAYPDVAPPAGPPMMGAGVSPEEVNAMGKVLESLNSIGESTVSSVMTEAKTEPKVAEYLSASMTGDTIKHKNYEIRIREIESFNGSKKVYDVIESSTGQTISDDLFLYEAANAIVKYLNKGYNFLSSEVREVIGLEQTYANLRTDAGIFRKRYNESIRRGDSHKVNLYETRFNSAKDKALQTKKHLKKIADSIK